MIGAALGYRVTLVMPANVSDERKKIVRAYGAELVLSDPLEGSDGAIVKARELAADTAKVLLRRSVQQCRELACALRHDRAGDLGADAAADHPSRGRRRDFGDVDGDGTPPQGIESGDHAG